MSRAAESPRPEKQIQTKTGSKLFSNCLTTAAGLVTLALSGRHAARRLPCKRSDACMSAAAACYEANLRASDSDNKACRASA